MITKEKAFGRGRKWRLAQEGSDAKSVTTKALRHGGTEAVEHLPNRPQITQILQMAGEKSVKSA